MQGGERNRKMLEKIKSFGINFIVVMATEIVRGFLREQIKNVTPEDLYNAIINDIDLWQITPEHIKEVGKNLKNRFGDILYKFQDLITTELILKWFSEDFPDLHSIIINTDGGLEWLDRQIRKIKKIILDEL